MNCKFISDINILTYKLTNYLLKDIVSIVIDYVYADFVLIETITQKMLYELFSKIDDFSEYQKEFFIHANNYFCCMNNEAIY